MEKRETIKQSAYSINKQGFTMIELIIVIAILGLLAAIAIPNFVNHRNRAFCSQVESDAHTIVLEISEYFSNPAHSEVPDSSDLNVKVFNPFEIKPDANKAITVIVEDKSGRCPDDYQLDNPQWDSALNTYSKIIN